jgi:hypothetical protein
MHTFVALSEEHPFLKPLPKLTKSAIKGVGLEITSKGTNPPEENPEKQYLAVWTCILGLQSNLWLDILVQAEKEEILKEFQNLTHEKTAKKTDGYDLLGEIANYIRGAIKHEMAKTEETLTPHIPHPIPNGNLHPINHYHCSKWRGHYQTENATLWVTILIHKQHTTAKSLGLLREHDISLQSIPISSYSNLEILAKGVILNKRWIEKLRKRFIKENPPRKILVTTPPVIYPLFHPEF